jgi:nitrogen fixation NifU-like protein
MAINSTSENAWSENMNEQYQLPKHVHIVPDKDLRFVEGAYVFDTNTTMNHTDHVVCMPHAGENFGNVSYFKLKLLCRKKGIRLSAYGHLNQFSEMGILADTVIAHPDNNRLNRLYRDSTTNCHVDRWLLPKVTNARYIEVYKMKHNSLNFLLSHGDCDPKWGEHVTDEVREKHALLIEAIDTISDDEVIEAMVWPDIFIRKSTWDIFHQLDLPNDVISCECKIGGGVAERVRPWLAAGNLPNVKGLDQSFQCDLLSKVGAHYMGIQFLASWLKNWMFVCSAGSANLFAIMPVKALFMYDFMFRNPSTETCLRGLSQRRYGDLGNEIPVFLPNALKISMARFMDTKKEMLLEAIEKLRECQYGVDRLPKNKTENVKGRETLLDHARSPVHHRPCIGATHSGCFENPSCGDSSRIELRVDRFDRILEASFQSQGCVINRAGGSMLMELLQGKSLQEAFALKQSDVLELLDSPLTPRRQICFLITYFALRRALGCSQENN